MRYWLLLLCMCTSVYAQQPVFLDEKSDADDIREAWQIQSSTQDGKETGTSRNPTWYLCRARNLQQAPRTAAHIHFDHDNFTIERDSHSILAEYAKVLREQPTAIVVIAGHTDDRGNDLYNWGLSHKRAEAVQTFLVEQHDIPPMQLRIKPYGETQPIADNDSEQGRALNRRVEFLYLGAAGS